MSPVFTNKGGKTAVDYYAIIVCVPKPQLYQAVRQIRKVCYSTMSHQSYRRFLTTRRRPESVRCTEKTFAVDREHSFHPSIFLLVLVSLVTRVQFRSSYKSKIERVSMPFIVQNLASKNEPHIFHRKLFLKKLKDNHK